MQQLVSSLLIFCSLSTFAMQLSVRKYNPAKTQELKTLLNSSDIFSLVRSFSLVKQLINDGADPGVKADTGFANGSSCLKALVVAREPVIEDLKEIQDRQNCIAFLLESGSDPNESNAFHSAIVKGWYTTVMEFLKYGAAINKLNQFGDTPLAYSLALKTLEIPLLLLGEGASPNIYTADFDGRNKEILRFVEAHKKKKLA